MRYCAHHESYALLKAESEAYSSTAWSEFWTENVIDPSSYPAHPVYGDSDPF